MFHFVHFRHAQVSKVEQSYLTMGGEKWEEKWGGNGAGLAPLPQCSTVGVKAT
jgi:hypothetical protein